MANLIITYWRDIPSAVSVKLGRKEEKRMLDNRFMEAIDMAAMRDGATATDDYLAHWRRGEPVSRSWEVAFSAIDEEGPIVLQHLLLGANAHINLDLAIAVATAVPAASWRSACSIHWVSGGGIAGFLVGFAVAARLWARRHGESDDETT